METVPAPPAEPRRSTLERMAGLGGVLYVVFFIVGTLLLGDGPETDDSPARLIEYFSDGGNRDKAAVGWLLALLGAFFFLWFLAALRQAVARTGDNGFLLALTTVGGAVYVALTVVAFSLDATLRTHAEETYRNEVYPQLIAVSDDIWYVLHSAAGIGAAAMMIGASLAALRAGRVPPWAAWLGVVAGISAIVSFFFIPWIVIATWIAIVGIGLWWRPSQGAQRAPR